LTAIYRCYTPRFNIGSEQISPTIPVIIRHEGSNECRLMHWRLIPYWAKDPSIGNRMINARAETLTEKPAFKLLVGSRRCIIPADGFSEWRKEGKRKVPMWVHLRNREPFGLAGLWDVCRDPIVCSTTRIAKTRRSQQWKLKVLGSDQRKLLIQRDKIA